MAPLLTFMLLGYELYRLEDGIYREIARTKEHQLTEFFRNIQMLYETTVRMRDDIALIDADSLDNPESRMREELKRMPRVMRATHHAGA